MELSGEIKKMVDTASATHGRMRVVLKSRSPFMWTVYILSFMWIWNRAFMDSFTTTIGRTIYVSYVIENNNVNDIALIRHELRHAKDSVETGILWWSLLYLFPQCLALIALLAFINLWFLVFLVFLLPFPAPFRMRSEARGYAENLFIYESNGYVFHVDRYRQHFVGPNYYYMAWAWSKPRNLILSRLEELRGRRPPSEN